MQQETWPSSLLAWEQSSQFPVRKGKGQAKLCFSSLFLLCLMVFSSCGVGGCVLLCLVFTPDTELWNPRCLNMQCPTVNTLFYIPGSSNSLRLLRDYTAVLCTWGKAPWIQSCMPKQRESKPGPIWWAQCWLSAWLLLIISSCSWAYIWGYIRSQSAFAQSLSVLLEGKSSSFNLECNQTWAY